MAEKSCLMTPKFCSRSFRSVPVSRSEYQKMGPAQGLLFHSVKASFTKRAWSTSLTARLLRPVGAPYSVAQIFLAPSPFTCMMS